ncbi:cytochrome d ubiquinol oxidase subunit II [Bacillus sp. FJAT-44742]|uniref:cytochrome d ubiquinol oxidase subunit II n=1 Tax=Bacillus sp. FJAT-44742 TaxID=2014005 RepID=UPI000C236022|nr:cytochrome d ubiquinol oxidase subunit II [Bacillus sp. FJAT-44742]
MNYEIISISILWLFLYGYLLAASVDFGAGFFHFYNKATKKSDKIDQLIQRYLSPVWEVTNVFLVFFFIGLVGFFPATAYYFGTVLLIPVSITIVLLAVRGSYYAFNTYGSKENLLYSFFYGTAGLFIPASLTVILAISQGGFLQFSNGTIELLYHDLLTSWLPWSLVSLAMVSVLFISSSFLAFYSWKAAEGKAYRLFRKYTLLWAFPVMLASLFVVFAISRHSPVRFQILADLSWIFMISFFFFCGAVFLIWKSRKPGLAFVCVMTQYFTSWFGYGASHLPYLLYPHLTIYDGVVNDSMAFSLLLAFAGGMVLLIPSLLLLMRLFLFDTEYVQGKKQ